MLQITIPAVEMYDERRQEFVSVKEETLQLEHSLVSLSKWEAKWRKAFLTKRDKTYEETIDYIKCMTLTPNVDDSVYLRFSKKNIDDILDYINDPMTATCFSGDQKGSSNKDVITAELIYYWMSSLNIPFECQEWHLNRLITYIRVCSIKNQPPKKSNKRDIMKQNAALNAARKQQLNTKG